MREGTQKNCKHPARRVARHLEGSRFVARQLYRLAASGSRERLEVRQFLWAVVSPQQNRGDGQNLALSHSREPPASNR
jgi:hypothetical protein